MTEEEDSATEELGTIKEAVNFLRSFDGFRFLSVKVKDITTPIDRSAMHSVENAWYNYYIYRKEKPKVSTIIPQELIDYLRSEMLIKAIHLARHCCLDEEDLIILRLLLNKEIQNVQ